MAALTFVRTVGYVATVSDDRAGMRLTLDIEIGAHPIAGVVRSESGAGREFFGWTSLASAIEAALETVGEADDQPSMVVDGGERRCDTGVIE
jgi:hypothetical protein